MKRFTALILLSVMLFALASCGGKDTAETTAPESAQAGYDETVPDNTEASATDATAEPDEETATSTAAETVTETTTQNPDKDPAYIQAVKAAYSKAQAEHKEYGTADSPVTAYMVDLNGDGYKDIIYQPAWFPYLMIYDNGKFVERELDAEVVAGSLFPSGEESGYFIDAEKGIIVIRYDGHTWGTSTYRGAEAFQIEGTNAKTIWIEYFDPDGIYVDDPKYRVESDEDSERVNDLVNEEFDSKQYNPRIKDYNLVNYYDVCTPWDGSVI